MQQSQQQRERTKLQAGREKVLKLVVEAERKGKATSLPYAGLVYSRFLEPLAAAVERDAKRQNGAGAFKKFASYLGSLDPKIVALRAIQAVLGLLADEGALDSPQPIGKRLAYATGRAVYHEYLMRHFADLSPPLFNSIYREFHRSMTSDERAIVSGFRQTYQREGYSFPVWGFGDTEQVGHYLVHQLAGLGLLERWSRTVMERGRHKVVTYVRLHEEMRAVTLAVVDHLAELPRAAGPLVEPPLPWDAQTNTGGGFHTPEMQKLMAYAVQGKGLGAVSESTVEAINNLQTVRWAVNAPVLAVVREAALRFDFGDVVSPEPKWPKPVCPEGAVDDALRDFKQAARKWYTERKVRAVKYMRGRKAVVEAEELAEYDAIWFAYYADFRGRLYARSNGVSPQGTDLEKGLLHFADGKPIRGEAAAFWFKVHGANKFGIDKVSFANRVRWVEEQHDALLAMAADPLSNRGWTEADCPVQFLAWCLEYAGWIEGGATFMSHLPVSLDGTCNGLQNYSALLRDEVGGAAVNLIDGQVPQDIYRLVADRTEELLRELPPSPLRDKWLAHGMNRKITKRTTMTLPYGCTRYASAEFIVKDYLEVVKPAEFDLAEYGAAGNFLSHVVWAALGDTVVKAREAMDWLRGWAKHCISTGQPVSWVTPTGLHVTSNYVSEKRVEVKSVAFNTRLVLRRPELDKPDPAKSANAVAPNFIHSLDASHLARVVNECAKRGYTVAAIHDDFGVHAADTQEFSSLIREKFVGMYLEHDVLQDMADATGYTEPPPAKGMLDLHNIKDSRYFFA